MDAMRTIPIVLLAAAMPSAAWAQSEPAPFLFAFAPGAGLGEFSGPSAVGELAIHVAGDGGYLAVQLNGGGGWNGDGNGVAEFGVAAGYRGYFLPGPFKLTLFAGGYLGREQEFEGDEEYGYRLAGGRASFGFARFFGRRFSIGAELCATVLYREQLSGPYWDYSGAGGQVDGRFRMTF